MKYEDVFLIAIVCIVLSFGEECRGSHSMRVRRSTYKKMAITMPPLPPFKVCPCSAEPCFHRGECMNKVIADKDGERDVTFRCNCAEEWSGERCDVCETGEGDVEEVCTNDCMYRNNDMCEDGGGGSVDSVRCKIGEDCADCSPRCRAKMVE